MYKITIERTMMITRTTGKNWKVVSEKDGDDQYGYTPEIEKEVETTEIILIQKVDDLDLNAVIIAINKLNEK